MIAFSFFFCNFQFTKFIDVASDLCYEETVATERKFWREFLPRHSVAPWTYQFITRRLKTDKRVRFEDTKGKTN